MIGARYVPNVALAQKLLWTHQILLLGYELELKLIEIVLILMQDGCTIYAECTIRLGNHFGHTQWNSKVIWVMWNLASVRSEMVLVSV
jgi:ABC-type microcin C transport system permease subunit YejB